MLPLAGPEEFDTEDNDKLPDDLQYLPPDKKREEDADIRTMLLETLMMVNTTLIISSPNHFKHSVLFSFVRIKSAVNILETRIVILYYVNSSTGKKI